MTARHLLLLIVVCTACGDSGDDSDGITPTDAASDDVTGGSGNETVPGDSEEEIARFLEDEEYRSSPWESETVSPREASSATSPHGRVRVWRNPTLLESQRLGNGVDLDAPTHTAGAMVVKEFYDDADVLLGRAAMLRPSSGDVEWFYYCSGPDERCDDSAPIYGADLNISCGFCHGGQVFTQTD